MKKLTILFLTAFASQHLYSADPNKTQSTWRGQSITEFDSSTENLDWQVVNDGVMGGLSKGNLERTEDGTIRFSGNLSLKNNGGFSTFRTGKVNYDLSTDLGLLLRVKGDGRTYEASLASDARFRGMEVTFSAEFETKANEWIQVKLPFDSFEGSFRGMELKKEVLNPAAIQRVGILLGDKKEGPFDLEIDYIQTYGKGQGADNLTKSPEADGELDIVGAAVKDGRFKTLVAALKAANLVEALQEGKNLTVFAPTDEAFAKLPKGTVEELLKPENKDRLKAILTYHVLPAAVKLGDAISAKKAETLQGDEVAVRFADGTIKVNEASLIDSDVEVSNGVIHVIDQVLLPAEPEKPTILTTAKKAGGFSTLLAAVEAAGLNAVLEGDGPFTVLAPTDDAFAALPDGTVESLLKKENLDQLASILKYHVIPGKVSAGDALNAKKAETVEGNTVSFSVKNGSLKANGATIQAVDVDGGNGIIHIIDAVLMPPKGADKKGPAKSKKMTSSGSPLEAITKAIKKGVPTYNSGDAKGCAQIYRDCIVSLTTNDQLSKEVRAALEESITRGDARDSSMAKAWFFRSVLDQTLQHVSS